MQRKYVRKLGDLRGCVTYTITPLEHSVRGFEYSSGHGYKVTSVVFLPLLYYANGDLAFGRLQESYLPTT
jgi:hypothetical protein